MYSNKATSQKSLDRREQIKLYFALSRTPHGLLDMATPALSVLLYLGSFPAFHVVVIGLLTAFAGYTAVYALNDIVDYRTDMAKGKNSAPAAEEYLDSLMVRHPMAQGLLTYRAGILWATGWATVALIGAYILNPMCVVIFLLGALLETLYCLLWRVSPWRSVISGFVKNSGPVAALFAVDPNPSPFFAIVMFLGLFFWEIGGQNILADWTDKDAAKQQNAKTIPLVLGVKKSASLVLITLTGATILMTFLFWLYSPIWNWIVALAVAASCSYLLLIPGVRLFLKQDRSHAMVLFNRASFFPLMLLCIVLGLIGALLAVN
jgi:4-hydroxybenzoate polyprenyltransferase